MHAGGSVGGHGLVECAAECCLTGESGHGAHSQCLLQQVLAVGRLWSYDCHVSILVRWLIKLLHVSKCRVSLLR